MTLSVQLPVHAQEMPESRRIVADVKCARLLDDLAFNLGQAFLHQEILGRPNTYRVEMMYPSWTEYLLMQERLTKVEREVIEKARAFHIGDDPPAFRHFLCVNRELHTQRHTVARPTAMPEAPLSIDRAPA